MGRFEKDISTMLAVTASDIYASGRMKYYLNAEGVWELGSVDFFDGRGSFRKGGFETNETWVAEYHSVHVPELDIVTFNPLTGQNVTKFGYAYKPDKPPCNLPEKYDTISGTDKGRRRATVKIFDYIRCNWDLDCMFTLTFDGAKIDRTSYEDIVKKVGEWLSNRVRRNGLKYIAVPEFHADGEAIHIHGVCNFAALKTEWSGVVKGGKRVYNITDFTLGHTAVKRFSKGITDRHAVSVYVAKYITKDSDKVGGRYFLHGGKLEKPREVFCEITAEDIEKITKEFSCSSYACNIPNGGIYKKYEVQHFEV